MQFDEIIRMLNARPYGDGKRWMALCPAHVDKNPSLSLSISPKGNLLLKCFAGCQTNDILKKLGISFRELFSENNKIVNSESDQKNNHKRIIVATYSYTDEQGDILFQCVRYHPKSFTQRRLNKGQPGWIYNLKDVRLVLYRLPELIKSQYVIIVEGERDVETLRALGFVASCNPLGAGKWRREFGKFLQGKDVIVIPDQDEVGLDHAAHIVGNCIMNGVKSICVLNLNTKDVSDYVEKFSSTMSREAIAQHLRTLIRQLPRWTPKHASANVGQPPAAATNLESGTREAIAK